MSESPADPKKQPEPSLNINLLPVEQVLEKKMAEYPDLKNYPALARKDLHLAELYRQAITGEKERLSRVQAVVEKGQVWIDVLAEVADEKSIEILREIMLVRGQTDRFVSGRVIAENLPQLAAVTHRLQAARPIGSALDRSVAAISADQETIAHEFPGGPIDGKDVIVGIVDVGGGDFKHPNFLNPNGTSRLLSLWDQNGTPTLFAQAPQPYNYGREFDQQRLNQALQASDPYADLQYAPQDKAHGTHVMDIAAGSGSSPGVAPEADLIFVHLGLPNPIDADQETLGSSTRLYDAVEYIFKKADQLQKPVVVNLSLATNGGPHDGTSLVEEMFDSLLREQPGRAIVVAAGNSYHTNTHDSGEIPPETTQTVDWCIETEAQPDWWQRQELEIWYDCNAELEVEIVAPNGESLGFCALGETKSTDESDAQTPLLLIHHQPPDSVPGDDENHINVFIDDRHTQFLSGTWCFHLSLTGSAADSVVYHAWIERNDEYPSHFDPASSEPEYTLNSIGNAELPIVVGAYYTGIASNPIAYFSSAGPSRNVNQPQKPEVSAPGQNICAASATHLDSVAKSGTSMAAPHVAGLIALMFQAARDRRNPPRTLSIQDVRQILLGTVDRNPPAGGAGIHNLRYGFGRVNGVKALKQIEDDS